MERIHYETVSYDMSETFKSPMSIIFEIDIWKDDSFFTFCIETQTVSVPIERFEEHNITDSTEMIRFVFKHI